MIKHHDIKQRFSIIGNSDKLDQAIDIAIQIAPTDISALITGESGVGKEAIPKIIHQHSQRKHNKLTKNGSTGGRRRCFPAKSGFKIAKNAQKAIHLVGN